MKLLRMTISTHPSSSSSSKHKPAKSEFLRQLGSFQAKDKESQRTIAALQESVTQLQDKMALLENAKVSARDCSNRNKRNNEALRAELSALRRKNPEVLEQNLSDAPDHIQKLRAKLASALGEVNAAQEALVEERREKETFKRDLEHAEEWKMDMRRLAALGPGRWKVEGE